jgi:hypothetical protein
MFGEMRRWRIESDFAMFQRGENRFVRQPKQQGPLFGRELSG